MALRIGRFTRPRRPLHLRWAYIKGHPLSFAGITVAVLLVLLVISLVAGEAIALLLAPISLGFVTWLFTNQATYLNRWPVTLASERPGNQQLGQVTPPHHRPAAQISSAERHATASTERRTGSGQARELNTSSARTSSTPTPETPQQPRPGPPEAKPGSDGGLTPAERARQLADERKQRKGNNSQSQRHLSTEA